MKYDLPALYKRETNCRIGTCINIPPLTTTTASYHLKYTLHQLLDASFQRQATRKQLYTWVFIQNIWVERGALANGLDNTGDTRRSRWKFYVASHCISAPRTAEFPRVHSPSRLPLGGILRQLHTLRPHNYTCVTRYCTACILQPLRNMFSHKCWFTRDQHDLTLQNRKRCFTISKFVA